MNYKLCVQVGLATGGPQGSGQLAFLLRSYNIRAWWVIHLEWLNFPSKDPSILPGISKYGSQKSAAKQGKKACLCPIAQQQLSFNPHL